MTVRNHQLRSLKSAIERRGVKFDIACRMAEDAKNERMCESYTDIAERALAFNERLLVLFSVLAKNK